MEKENLVIYLPDGTEHKVREDIIQGKMITFDKPEGIETQKWFDESERRQEIRNEVEDMYDYAKIEINSDRPIAVGITGDWHLGGNVNTRMLEKEIQILAEHPLVAGGFFMGDLTDSANFNPAQDENSFSLEEQTEWLYSILNTIGEDRILAMWRGNHDYKWERKHGISKYKGLSSKYNCPVFYGPAYVDFFLNDVNYRMMGSHKLRGNSIYTNAHPAVRGHREVQGLDLTFSGHLHKKGKVEQSVKEFNSARKVYSITTGTYSEGSGYAKDSGFGTQKSEEQGMWWAILSHDRKMIRIQDTDQMLETMGNYL
jgi:hypothetical protein